MARASRNRASVVAQQAMVATTAVQVFFSLWPVPSLPQPHYGFAFAQCLTLHPVFLPRVDGSRFSAVCAYDEATQTYNCGCSKGIVGDTTP